VNNSYYPLINETIADEYMADYKAIIPILEKCHQIDGDAPDCSAAGTAVEGVDSTYGGYYPDFDYYDIRAPSDDPFPPATYISYLNDPAVMKAIGANPDIVFTDCSEAIDVPFSADGDGKFVLLP
jgi:carboxypeptidase D